MQYQKTPEELFSELHSGTSGLTEEKVSLNRERYGSNVIEDEKKKSTIQIFLEQFKDFLVIILIVAAIVSAFMKDIESCAVILVVITMNAILGTVQTVKAEKSLSSLKKLSSPDAKVIRGGVKTVIPSDDIVVGDILVFEAGDKIAADGRIIECAGVKVNESALTGESTDVDKTADTISKETPLAERYNMIYSGSFVTNGRGTAIITETGMQTEVGKIASLIRNASERKTPLQNSLDSFGKKLSVAILIICGLVFGTGVFRGEPVMDSFMFAIALAVAAIPEALSSIVTIVLSFGTQKMSKENAIVRKLYAVEGLGSIAVICSDKTGTITQNKMTVRKVFADGELISAKNFSPDTENKKMLINAMVLCNDSVITDGKEIGDPTETALIRFADNHDDIEKIKRDNPRTSEVPFDSDRKLMSTVSGGMMYTKGAADVIISRILSTEEEKSQILKITSELSEQGLRVLAYACKKHTDSVSADDENNLEFIGLSAMMDPPREEVKEAVEKCRMAGIKPVMITGDHVVTASAIAKEVGILDENSKAVEGSVLDSKSDEELKTFVRDIAVYARVTPEHKIRIVKAWQANNCNVSMTGDGVNDAPALKQADIGVAMGITGTDVSKDASGIILTDDNFATIIKAVRNGRNIYSNIKKSILFLLSGNFAGLLVVLYCSLLALPVPFEAIHLLFINLLTDSLPAIGLGLEPYTDSVMKEKPRKANESLLTKSFLAEIGIYGLIIGIATAVSYMSGLKTSPEAASTMAFATLCASRLFHGFSCKSNTPVLFTKKMFNNKTGILAFIFGILLLSAVLFITPLKGLFRTDILTSAQILTVLACSFGSMLVIQISKLIKL